MENLTLSEATQLINFYKNKSSDIELQFLRMQSKYIDLQEQHKQAFQKTAELQMRLDAINQEANKVAVVKVDPPADLVGVVKTNSAKKKAVAKKTKK